MPKPLICTFCGRILKEYNKFHLCSTCLSSIKKVYFPENYLENTLDICSNKPGNEANAYDVSLSVCLYEGAAREMVHRLKYRDRREAAITMAAMIDELICTSKLKYDFIVPVPVSRKRYRKRGYNHAELIANELSNITGVRCIDAVKRVKDTIPQVLLNTDERWYNVKDAFKCDFNFDNKSVLLIDDVITTGATAHYCAVELKASGAGYVIALSFAKATL